MSHKSLYLLAAAILLFGAAVLFFWTRANLVQPPSPITLRYVYPTNSRFWTAGKFWVTNHSNKMLAVELRTVEIQSNGVWTPYSNFTFGTLLFRSKTKMQLAPKEAGFCVMLDEGFSPPTNVVWRVRATVSEELGGIAAVASAIKHEPSMLQLRKLGYTNVPINPFATRVTHFGRSSIVTSEEVMPPDRANWFSGDSQ